MRKKLVGLAALACAGFGLVVSADPIYFSGNTAPDGTGHALAATAEFSIYSAGGKTHLKVVLTNTSQQEYSSSQKAQPNEVLTAIFFDMTVAPGVTSFNSATPSAIVNGTDQGDLRASIVHGGWDYIVSTSDDPTAGTGTAGFGIFSGDLLNASGGASSGNGQINYGVIGENYHAGDGNTPVDAAPLVQDHITFDFTILPDTYTLSDIKGVTIYYGTGPDFVLLGVPSSPGGDTSNSQGVLPLPSVATLTPCILAGFGLRRRRYPA